MKKRIALTFTLLLTAAFALTQISLASQDDMKKKADKPQKAAAAPKTAAPKSDADIQKCITDKLAANKNVTGGAATVASGDATLTGEAKSAGAKGGATKTAKSCGAKNVTNNMTTAAPAPKAGGEKKKAEAPKK